MVLFFSNQLHQILTWATGGNIHMLFFILWLGVYFAQLITIMRCELSRRKVITTSYIMDISGGKKSICMWRQFAISSEPSERVCSYTLRNIYAVGTFHSAQGK